MKCSKRFVVWTWDWLRRKKNYKTVNI